MSRPISRRMSWAYMLVVALLAVSGTMQMPIASRYRIVAVPGLGWLGDFWLTHRLHYAGAIALLALTSYLVTRWVIEWRRDYALTPFGQVRALLLAALIATGAVRVLKNLPNVSFPPEPVMLVDWTHLGLAFLLGLLALTRLGTGAACIRPRVQPGRQDSGQDNRQGNGPGHDF